MWFDLTENIYKYLVAASFFVMLRKQKFNLRLYLYQSFNHQNKIKKNEIST